MKLPYIEAGEIVTTHGVRGEVKVLSWLDSPEMLCEFDRCRISGREYVMDSVRVQKTCNLVKLRGVDTMEDAQKLRGKAMELYREDISDELIFAAELVDVEVYARRRQAMAEVLTDAGYSFQMPAGAFYFFPQAPGGDDVAFVNRLVEERVLAVPGSGFGCPGYFRLAFCVDESVIRNAAEGFARAYAAVAGK